MQLRKLIRLLKNLERKGYGRREVLVEKDTLNDGNGCFTMCPIDGALVQSVYNADDDGGIAMTNRGVEIERDCIVIYGWGKDLSLIA